MSNPLSQEELDAWYSGRPLPGVRFNLNDAVLVHEADDAASPGSVISLVQVRPRVEFEVDLRDGKTVLVSQKSLTAYAT